MPATADPAIVAAFAGRVNDYEHYRRLLRIEEREGRALIPYQPRVTQRELQRAVVLQYRAGKPFRAVVPKARQLGVSTWKQTRHFHKAATRPGVNAVTVAHDDETSKTLHAMQELMFDHVPEVVEFQGVRFDLRPEKVKAEQGKRLHLKHPGGISRLTVFTAGGSDIRGGNITDLHGSEVAHWPNQSKLLTGLLQSHHEVRGTEGVLESTPNGVGDEFYGMCTTATSWDPRWAYFCSGESDWLLIFCPWYDDPGYRVACPGGIKALGRLDDEEKDLIRRAGVDADQLAFRRHVLRNRCRGKIDVLHQEWPSYPEEGFLSSGRRYYEESIVSRIQPRAPRVRGDVEGSWPAPYRVVKSDDDRAPLVVWQLPEKGHRYVIAVDAAGEVRPKDAPNRPDPKDIRDWTVATVVDRFTQRIVAVYRTKTDLTLAARKLAMLGKWYRHALVGVEVTGGYGYPVVQELQNMNYGNLYTRNILTRLGNNVETMTTELGFDTTTKTRPRVLEGLRDVVREHPDWIPCVGLQGELRTFVVGDRGPAADNGAHDDRVLSAAWAYQLLDEYPQARLLDDATPYAA